jgi:hypothetical protein
LGSCDLHCGKTRLGDTGFFRESVELGAVEGLPLFEHVEDGVHRFEIQTSPG